MRVTTTKLCCDRCGDVIKEGLFHGRPYMIPVAYKSRIWGMNYVKLDLCIKCSKEYFKITKEFLKKAKPNDLEED